MGDKLVEISCNKWISLRDLYLDNWPDNMVGYYTIDNYIKWNEREKNIKNLKIFSINGDWNDGTFLVVDRYNLIINSLDATCTRLRIALLLLDWSPGYFITTLLKRHHRTVIEVLNLKQLIINDEDCLTSLYYLPRDQAALLHENPPEGVILRSMSDEDTELANTAWPNRMTGTSFLLKRLAAWNPNIAAYNADGEMLAWTFRLQAGALGALQVSVDHKRKGYGSLVLRAISKKLASLNMDTFGCVNKKNYPSIRMFEKCGFKHVDDVYWIIAYPQKMFEWNDD